MSKKILYSALCLVTFTLCAVATVVSFSVAADGKAPAAEVKACKCGEKCAYTDKKEACKCGEKCDCTKSKETCKCGEKCACADKKAE